MWGGVEGRILGGLELAFERRALGLRRGSGVLVDRARRRIISSYSPSEGGGGGLHRNLTLEASSVMIDVCLGFLMCLVRIICNNIGGVGGGGI